MISSIICRVTWSAPMPRTDLLEAGFGISRGHYVYALMVADQARPGVVRIGASADLASRLQTYRALDLIPGSAVSWWAVSDSFANDLKPLLATHFSNQLAPRPPHLEGKSLSYCIERELKSIEYKVESLLLAAYTRRHGRLPPGNARTGSERGYLEQVGIVEDGDVQVLDKPCAEIPSIQVSGEQIMRLLW